MQPQRFDALTRSFGNALNRRKLLKGLGAATLASLAIENAKRAIAQDATTSAKDRFISVRTYAVSGSMNDAIAGLHDLIAVMEKQPGFVSYDVVASGDTELLAISTFLDQTTAVAAAKQEDDWIAANASSMLSTPPSISSGDVALRSELNVGCDCITGTQNPCNSERLICCATTDRMGGPGVCLTAETTCPAVASDVTPTTEPTVAPANPTATPTTAAPTATPCSGKDCACNGGVQNTCDQGLICCQEKPGLPGGSGTCKSQADCTPTPCTDEGCQCATGTQNPCADGLVCCTAAGEGTPVAPGGPGVCRSAEKCDCTDEGCHCNGGVQNACDDGLTCCQGSHTLPGGTGTCEATCP